MAVKRTRKVQAVPDSKELGTRIRRSRLDRGLTLQDVESLTDGALKAATLSAYELGDTNIPALRLRQLAEVYEASVDDLLSSTGSTRSILATDGLPPPTETLVRLDLSRLGSAKGRDAEIVAQLVDSIQRRRSTKTGRYFAMRGDDLIAAAAIIGREIDEVLLTLQKAGVLRRPRGRPPGKRS